MGSPGSPGSLNFHVGLSELKPALGGGWASFGDTIMYKKSLALSPWGGATSSSAAWDVLGPNGTMPAFGDPRPWLGHGGIFLLRPASLQAGGCPATAVHKAGGPLLQHGLVPVPDYPLPTDGRGKSSLSARWSHLILFLGEA